MNFKEKSKVETPNARRIASSTERIFGNAVMGHGYTALPSILVRGQKKLGLNPVHFNILVQLLSYWYDPSKPPFPLKRDLCDRLGISETTLKKHMRELENIGLITREQQVTAAGDYGSNIYHLDGLIAALKRLVPDFDAERKEKSDSRKMTETPNARALARSRLK